MRRKGIFTLLTAVFMVLAFSATAFAANQVFLKTTVPNIPKSECYQAGSDTMEMDPLTTIREGDVIQFTLNNKVTVCKTIDMFLRISTGTALDDVSVATAPVTANTGGTVSAPGTGVWGFLVKATNADTVAGQIITLTLQRRINGVLVPYESPGRPMTYSANPAGANPTAERLIVKLFDGKIAGTESAFFEPGTSSTTYDDSIETTDNALCIDTLTQNFPDEYVQNTPDSIPGIPADRLNFSGDYRIAHILSELTYTLYTCNKANCGELLIGSKDQETNVCTAFEFESMQGYCTTGTNKHGPSRFILQASQPFETTAYTVKMEILVNGSTGENGVYWSNEAPGYGRFTSGSAACSGSSTAFTGATTYLRSSGSAATPVAPISTCDGVGSSGKAVTLTTASQNLFSLGDTYLWINFPQFNYNLAEIQAGDVVSVRVTLSKSTCGVVHVQTICIGTFGCSQVASTYSCFFPYFTSTTGAGDWWNGMAIVNTGSTSGTATLTAYVKDGTSSTAVFTVPANSMVVGAVEDTEFFPWSGSRGDSEAYITVSTNFPVDGFAMMGLNAPGDASMGYICRKQ